MFVRASVGDTGTGGDGLLTIVTEAGGTRTTADQGSTIGITKISATRALVYGAVT